MAVALNHTHRVFPNAPHTVSSEAAIIFVIIGWMGCVRRRRRLGPSHPSPSLPFVVGLAALDHGRLQGALERGLLQLTPLLPGAFLKTEEYPSAR